MYILPYTVYGPASSTIASGAREEAATALHGKWRCTIYEKRMI
jgi:hypothetical protein